MAKIADLYTEIKEKYKKFKTNKKSIFFIAKTSLGHFYCNYYGNASRMLFDTNDADETGSTETFLLKRLVAAAFTVSKQLRVAS